MSNIGNNETILFKYILQNPQYYKSIKKNFFSNKDLGSLLSISTKFYDRYKEIPSAHQVIAVIKEKEIDINEEIVKTAFGIDLSLYDTEWLRHTVESWIKWASMRKNLIEACEIAKLTEVNADNVDEVTQQVIDKIDETKSIDFNFSEGLDFFDAESHRQANGEKISSGYNYVDTMLGGGYDPKTLISYVGPSNIGKCVTEDTVINIRNKKTGETLNTTIGVFYKMANA